MEKFKRFNPVDEAEVAAILRKMKKTYCSNDPCDLRAFNFDIICGVLSEIFSVIINASFSSGIFPQTEKSAIVRPLLKNGKDPDEFSSYRPLYNTSMLAKVLENVCLCQLRAHLENFEAIPKFQSAYRRYHSVETALCRIYNDLIVNKLAGSCTMLVMLDLTAAFDTVEHSILLNDLKLLGLEGNVLSWFHSYLENRSFVVEIDDGMSERGEMTTGVPQGTILAPILFSIYSIELYHILQRYNIDCHFYADDTQLMVTINDKESAKMEFRSILGIINEWMSSRRLKLNAGKTECIIFGSTPRLRDLGDFTSIVLGDGTDIVLSEAVRDLGVFFDRNLSLTTQINNTRRKAIGNLINISRVAKFINRKLRMKLIHCLVLSHLDFCNSIYAGLPNSSLHHLQMIIHDAARLVVGLPRFSRERITPVCIELHILPVKARIQYKICLLVYKALNFGQPQYLAELLHFRVPSRTLRGDYLRLLEEPMIGTTLYSNRCFTHCAPRMYNSLPLDVREAPSIASFKRMLKTFLFTQAYDTENLSLQHAFTT